MNSWRMAAGSPDARCTGLARGSERSLRRLCVAALLLLSVAACHLSPGTAAGQRPLADTESVLAIIGANVIPMAGNQRVLPNQTVIVRAGRISTIGPRGQTAVPPNAVRVDAAGQYLTPALADMHVHLENFDDPAYLQLFLVYGVTFVRSMDGRPQILEWKRAAANGSLHSPSIHTAGQVLDGDPPARSDNRIVGDADAAQRAVDEQADAGYDFVKIYTNLSAEAYRTIVEAARARGLPVTGHVPRAVAFRDLLVDGIASIEHLGDFADALRVKDSELPTQAQALKRRLAVEVDPTRLAALATELARSGTWIVPTMVQSDRAVANPAMLERWLADPAVAAVDQGIVESYWRGSVLRAGGGLDEQGWSLVARGRANRLLVVGAFHRAGVRMLVGTDTPQPFVIPGASVHEELVNFVAAGLTPEQALAAATREAARFVGQGSLWGTVEPGKRADLLLLEANPLADIGAMRRIVGLVAQGRWLPAKRLGEMRAAVERVAAASR
jgi:imidazolonepropionase-like amidohydrolase